jgi:hypothetical protein
MVCAGLSSGSVGITDLAAQFQSVAVNQLSVDVSVFFSSVSRILPNRSAELYL